MNLHTKYIHYHEYDFGYYLLMDDNGKELFKGEPEAMVEMIDLIAQTDDITINGQPFEG